MGPVGSMILLLDFDAYVEVKTVLPRDTTVLRAACLAKLSARTLLGSASPYGAIAAPGCFLLLL